MPMFDYQCKQCGDKSEYIVRNSDTETPLCKACGSRRLTRLLGAASYLTRPGSGATIPDYPKMKI